MTPTWGFHCLCYTLASANQTLTTNRGGVITNSLLTVCDPVLFTNMNKHSEQTDWQIRPDALCSHWVVHFIPPWVTQGHVTTLNQSGKKWVEYRIVTDYDNPDKNQETREKEKVSMQNTHLDLLHLSSFCAWKSQTWLWLLESAFMCTKVQVCFREKQHTLEILFASNDTCCWVGTKQNSFRNTLNCWDLFLQEAKHSFRVVFSLWITLRTQNTLFVMLKDLSV